MVTKITAAALDNKVVKYESSAGALISGKNSGARVKSLSGLTTGNEALSVYDEGTWTPVFKVGGTDVSSTETGHYTRIGNRVFYYGHCEINRGTAVGNMTIEGLPVAANSAISMCPGTIMTGDKFDSTPSVFVSVSGGATTLGLFIGADSTSGSFAAATGSLLATNTACSVWFSGMYFV
jgi:hypothetical protein